MPPARPLLGPALCVVGILATMPGCGSADVGALKAQLGGVADAVDGCVAKTNDARRCVNGATLGPLLPEDVEIGSGTGQIAIRAPRPLRYALIGNAGDGATFSITAEPVGARKRTCEPAGVGDCPKGGAW